MRLRIVGWLLRWAKLSVTMVSRMHYDFVFVLGWVMGERGSVFLSMGAQFLAKRTSKVGFG
jgi:hypothetical protein